MRNSDRLDKFYEEFKNIHKKYFPNMRFGQLCSNFFGWLYSTYKKDLFFPEEDEMLEYLREYTHDNSPLHHNWKLNGHTF